MEQVNVHKVAVDDAEAADAFVGLGDRHHRARDARRTASAGRRLTVCVCVCESVCKARAQCAHTQ